MLVRDRVCSHGKIDKEWGRSGDRLNPRISCSYNKRYEQGSRILWRVKCIFPFLSFVLINVNRMWVQRIINRNSELLPWKCIIDSPSVINAKENKKKAKNCWTRGLEWRFLADQSSSFPVSLPLFLSFSFVNPRLSKGTKGDEIETRPQAKLLRLDRTINVMKT